MWKIVGLLFLAVVIYFSSSLENRFLAYKVYRARLYWDYYQLYKKEPHCKETKTAETCAMKIIEDTGGFKTGFDFGIPVAMPVSFANHDMLYFLRFYGGAVKAVEPKKFWLAGKEGPIAHALLKNELKDLITEFQKTREVFNTKVKPQFKSFEERLELERFLQTMDLKIEELQNF